MNITNQNKQKERLLSRETLESAFAGRFFLPTMLELFSFVILACLYSCKVLREMTECWKLMLMLFRCISVYTSVGIKIGRGNYIHRHDYIHDISYAEGMNSLCN